MASQLNRAKLLSHLDDRTLPDGRIGPTDLHGWRRVIDSLRWSGWHIENAPVATADLAVLFGPDREPPTVKVSLGRHRVKINVFLLEPDSIDFDFATDEMADQNALDYLAGFIRLAAVAADADCELSAEGSDTDVVARYGRAQNCFGVLGDGQGRLEGAVWNRAALGAGSEGRGPGEKALSSVLLAHGLISSGSVARAVRGAMAGHEIDASIAGFRYLGLRRAASVIESAKALSWSDSGEAHNRLDVSYAQAIPSEDRIAQAAALRNAVSDDAFAA